MRMRIFWQFWLGTTLSIVLPFACAWAQVEIAVLDSPVQSDHPELTDKLDREALQNHFLTRTDGSRISWYDYNEQMLNSLRRINERGSPSPLRRLLVSVAIEHGTQVSYFATHGIENARLLHFPQLDEMALLSAEELEELGSEAFRSRLRKRYTEISEVLLARKVRVMNLSFSSDPEASLEYLNAVASDSAREKLGTKLRSIAREHSRIEIEELQQFILSNPDTVFVLAAGNEGAYLTARLSHSALLSAPNLIKVASLEADGKSLADYSNRSANDVDIAAIGTKVEYVTASGLVRRISGTSFAAPQVSLELAILFEGNANLTTDEAILALLTGSAISVPELKPNVSDGLALNPCAARFHPQPR